MGETDVERLGGVSSRGKRLSGGSLDLLDKDITRSTSHSLAFIISHDSIVSPNLYIGKLGTTVVDAKIRFSVNFFRKNRRSRGRKNRANNPKTLDIAATFNSQTGDQVIVQPEAIDPEIMESSSYILQNIKVGQSECLVFFDSGANSHFIDGNVAVKEGLQAVSSERTRLRMIAGG